MLFILSSVELPVTIHFSQFASCINFFGAKIFNRPPLRIHFK